MKVIGIRVIKLVIFLVFAWFSLGFNDEFFHRDFATELILWGVEMAIFYLLIHYLFERFTKSQSIIVGAQVEPLNMARVAKIACIGGLLVVFPLTFFFGMMFFFDFLNR